MLITTTQNSRIKNLRALYKDKNLRKTQGVFIAEGVNLVKDIPKNFLVKELYIKESKYNQLTSLEKKFGIEAAVVKDGIFDAVSDTVTPSGVIALIEKPEFRLKAEGEMVILLDGIKDAGNMGTIIRSSAAKGVKTVISINGTDAYSPKAIRASMGGIFYVNVIECSAEEALELLNGYKIVVLDMGGESIYGYKSGQSIALTVGSEAHGLSEVIKNKADDVIAIPMKTGIESLNAAVSISIAMFLIK